MLRRSKDVGYGPGFHDLSHVHHGDTVADVADHTQVVRDEQVGQVAAVPAVRGTGSEFAPAPKHPVLKLVRRRLPKSDPRPGLGQLRCAGAAPRKTHAGNGQCARRPRPTRLSNIQDAFAALPAQDWPGTCSSSGRTEDLHDCLARIQRGVGILEDKLNLLTGALASACG